MNHIKVIEASRNILTERGEKYGEMRKNFARIGLIASEILGKPVSGYDIAIIMHALKLSRINASPGEMDHYIDGINYLAFAAEMVEGKDAGQAPEEF